MIWAGLCLGTALALRHRPFVASVLGLVLWCVVPGVAGHHLTGSSTGLSQTHPAAVYVLVVAAVQLASGSAELRLALNHRRAWTWTALFVVVVAAATGLAFVAGSGRWAAVANQLLGPLTLFFLVGGCLLARPDRVGRLIRVVVVLAAVEAALSIVQLVAQRPLVFSSDYARQYWFDESRPVDRASTPPDPVAVPCLLDLPAGRARPLVGRPPAARPRPGRSAEHPVTHGFRHRGHRFRLPALHLAVGYGRTGGPGDARGCRRLRRLPRRGGRRSAEPFQRRHRLVGRAGRGPRVRR